MDVVILVSIIIECGFLFISFIGSGRLIHIAPSAPYFEVFFHAYFRLGKKGSEGPRSVSVRTSQSLSYIVADTLKTNEYFEL